jgi:hypothetical protein
VKFKLDENLPVGSRRPRLRDLGQARDAERCARQAVGPCLAGHSRTRAQRTTIYATAHLDMGEIDAAAAAGEQIVREGWNLRSGHVFSEIAQLAAAIAPAGTPAAAGFLDQARDPTFIQRRGLSRAAAS